MRALSKALIEQASRQPAPLSAGRRRDVGPALADEIIRAARLAVAAHMVQAANPPDRDRAASSRPRAVAEALLP